MQKREEQNMRIPRQLNLSNIWRARYELPMNRLQLQAIWLAQLKVIVAAYFSLYVALPISLFSTASFVGNFTLLLSKESSKNLQSISIAL